MSREVSFERERGIEPPAWLRRGQLGKLNKTFRILLKLGGVNIR